MIQIEHLCKTIRGRSVLDNVTLHVKRNRIVGLSGPNGSGKTMLMRVVVGLVQPTSGTARVNGLDPWVRSCALRVPASSTWPTIGLLLERPAFLGAYTGMRNLQLLASVRSDHASLSNADLRNATEAMGLDPDDTRKYAAYSLGMRQRLAIAAATVGRPELVILDEPTNALDAEGVDLAVRRIRHVAAQGSTVLLACHDREILRDLSDEIWYLAEGHVDDHEELGHPRGEESRGVA